MTGVTWWTLTELTERPELLVPPANLIPQLAWEGRVTLLAGREKSGKSTLTRQGIAALLTGGAFLGESVAVAPAAWLALDEPVGDLVRGLHELGARHGLLVTDQRPGFEELAVTLEREGIRVLVVDTLTEFAGGLVEDANSASQFQPLLAGLRGIARRTGAGIVLLHHLNKAGTGYADSRQIGAGVDVIVEMRQADEPPTRRTFKVRGRGVAGDFALDWTRDDGYTVSHGELSLDARLLATIEAQPGLGLTKLRAAVTGANADKAAALKGLIYRGAVVDRGEGGNHAYYTPAAASERAQTGTPRGRLAAGVTAGGMAAA